MMDFSSKKLALQQAVSTIYSKLLLYFFTNHKKNTLSTDRSVIYLENNILYFLYAEYQSTLLKITALEQYTFANPKELSTLVANLSRQFSLQATPVYWVLNQADYQLAFIESLPVPEAEIKQALQWRLKTTIQKQGDVLIDYFNVPAKPGLGTQAMVAAVSANKQVVEDFFDICRRFQLNLSVIDIPELSLRNLTATHEVDEKSTALIYVGANEIILNITREKILYLTRKISIPSLDSMGSLNELSLEIIRYFDYFQSYWRFAAPSRVYLSASDSQQSILIEKLSQSLSVTIMPLTLEKPIVTPKRLTNQYWLLLGELFREMTNDSTTH